MCMAAATIICLMTALAFVGKEAAHWFVTIAKETMCGPFQLVPGFEKKSISLKLVFLCFRHIIYFHTWRDITIVIIVGSIVIVVGWALIIIVSIIAIVSIIVSVIPITLVVSPGCILALVLAEGIIISRLVIHEIIHWVRN